MKTCCRCNRELDDSCFVKSPRYRDGLTQPCKDCRKQARIKTLADNPMCARCGEKPHLDTSAYCYECDRIMKGRDVVPKFHRDPNNTTMCSRCKINPRLPYHGYCQECKNESTNDWFKNHVKTQEEIHISRVRAYAGYLERIGEVQRTPCVFCGAPHDQWHHYDYEPKTRNFESVCLACHVVAHRFLRTMLTLMMNGAIRLPAP